MLDLPFPLWGKPLKILSESVPEHKFIIEGLLYEHDSLLISSDSGKGKSLISIQVAMQLSAGLPVFGCLQTSGRKRIWYMQMERHQNESLERMNKLSPSIAWSCDNFFLDTEVQILNFINPSHYAIVEARGVEIDPDVIFIDPLYGIAQGLSQDKIAAEVSKCLTMLKKKLNCAIWINHHIVKDTFDNKGKKIQKDDPFYGATWIKAHVTGSYLMIQTETGVEMIKKKDNHDVLLDNIVTVYDHETYLSTVDPDKFNYSDRFKIFINIVFSRSNKTFKFKEAQIFVGCAVRTMRNLVSAQPFSEVLIPHRSNGVSTLYEIKSGI